MLEPTDVETTADEDRDDDDTNVEGEVSTGGPTRNLEFDIDPLQKLSMEEFV